MVYSKGNAKLVFDIKIKSPQGMLLAARLKRTAIGNCIQQLSILQETHRNTIISWTYGRGRAMMIQANVPDKWKPVVAQKEFEMVTKLDGLIPVMIDDMFKPRVEHFEGSTPPFAKHLRTWG